MKKILCFFVLFSTNVVMADEKPEVPELLRDSKIVTTLKNGKTYSFDGNEYMVVRRKAKKKPAEEKVEVEKKAYDKLVKNQQKQNRVRLIAGVGPSGFNSRTKTNYVEVKTENDALGGVGYDRMLNDTISIGGQVLSNGTYAVGVGLDF
jgi:hypothetical protein